MRTKFAHYYPTTADTFSSIWKDCQFVFDTNVLLDLYRYSSGTSTELTNVLGQARDRIWLPHQVALEFFRRRHDVIASQETMFTTAIDLLEQLIKHAEAEIHKKLTFRVHPQIDKKEFLQEITRALDKIRTSIDRKRKVHTLLAKGKKDHILETISDLFDGRVGDPLSSSDLTKLFSEGKSRYAEKIPPGYEDATGSNKKEGNQIYNDLIIWFQVIDYARAVNKPIIFVSNDSKEDWWWYVGGKTMGFRPELAQEMKEKANVDFYMYNSDQFMVYAKQYLRVTVKNESIKEVRDVRENDQRRTLATLNEHLSSLRFDALRKKLEYQGKIGSLLNESLTKPLAFSPSLLNESTPTTLFGLLNNPNIAWDELLGLAMKNTPTTSSANATPDRNKEESDNKPAAEVKPDSNSDKDSV